MSRRVCIDVRVFGMAACLLSSVFVASAAAQTTVVLDNPSGEVVDAYVRAGTYADTVNNNGVLATKANSNASYVRRALLKFDTQNHVPANATIRSATLTLTLRRSEASTRTISAYRVTNSFDETAATWYRRKSDGSRWTAAGGDLTTRYATASVGTAAGSRVTFDVTSLVQATVKGTFGSRYTRIGLADAGSSSSSSYKEFYSSEASNSAVRPRLTVVYGGTTTSAPAPAPAPAPSSTPTTSTSTLKVLHWNIHYGLGTNGAYGMDKYVDWIIRINPDLVSLNEVEKYVAGHGNENQPAILAAKLTARTGRTWYYHHANRYGNWGANGGGNLILSRFPILAKSQLALSYNRSAALATVNVNGRNINFISTHLANKSEGAGARATQILQLRAWARGFSEQRIIAGDFNAGLSNLPYIEGDYDDGWNAAVRINTDQGYPGNTSGATYVNGYRIDFVFKSSAASRLAVRAARVFDTRNASGVRPSDHYPVLITYGIN
jgi:endonuclease/exonuclease/phosphatase family metal-dependent hydrolase